MDENTVFYENRRVGRIERDVFIWYKSKLRFVGGYSMSESLLLDVKARGVKRVKVIDDGEIHWFKLSDFCNVIERFDPRFSRDPGERQFYAVA